MIKIENMSFAYPHNKILFENFNLQLQQNECVALLGHNGSGKSTMLNMLCGLVLPSSGRITIADLALNKNNLVSIRQIVGLVFQNPDNQLFMPTISEDLAFGLRNQNLSEQEIQTRIAQLAGELGISDLLRKNSFELSGGEKRTAALASVMVMQPQVILFDEPTAFLDLRTRRLFIERLKSIKTTKIIVTHDLGLAKQLCNRAIVLDDGQVVYDGSMDCLDYTLLE